MERVGVGVGYLGVIEDRIHTIVMCKWLNVCKFASI